MPKIVDKDAKRLELVEAATQVFARDGYASAKIADVAELAGVGKGTIYEYFDTKADLFWAVCESLVAWPEDAERFSKDPVEGFRALIRAMVASYEASDAFYLVLLDYWAAILREKNSRITKERAEELYVHPRELVASVVKSGQRQGLFGQAVKADVVAALAVAGIEGLRSQKIQDPRHVDFDLCVEVLIESLLGYLTVRASG